MNPLNELSDLVMRSYIATCSRCRRDYHKPQPQPQNWNCERCESEIMAEKIERNAKLEERVARIEKHLGLSAGDGGQG